MKDKGLLLIVKFVLETQRLEYFQAGRLAAASFEDLSKHVCEYQLQECL